MRREVKLTKEEHDEAIEMATFEKRLRIQQQKSDYKYTPSGQRQQCCDCGNNLYKDGICPKCDFF